MAIRIPVYQPSLTGNEKKYVNECLDTTWISSKGEFIGLFESQFASYVDGRYAASVSNGTVALHIALLALGIGPGDEVIVPTLTYISSVNAITYTGAKPVFVDSLADTWQMDPADVERKVTAATKCIMVVHLYGQPCDMDALMVISSKYSLQMVEDCAEAIGTLYKDRHVGTFGNIATFSFFGNKMITTGEGGMVVTNDKELYDRTVHLKGQGLSKNTFYWHDVIGYNYRMTNICAAIGLAQLEQVDHFASRKIEIAGLYQASLKNSSVVFHCQIGDVRHSFWMCSILVDKPELRDELRNFLLQRGVETRPLFFPIHTMPIYLEENSYPVAEDLSRRGINLPSHPSLSNQEIIEITTFIKSFLSAHV
jgi:perosamine synthetase